MHTWQRRYLNSWIILVSKGAYHCISITKCRRPPRICQRSFGLFYSFPEDFNEDRKINGLPPVPGINLHQMVPDWLQQCNFINLFILYFIETPNFCAAKTWILPAVWNMLPRIRNDPLFEKKIAYIICFIYVDDKKQKQKKLDGLRRLFHYLR